MIKCIDILSVNKNNMKIFYERLNSINFLQQIVHGS